jgi:hypothetical protein
LSHYLVKLQSCAPEPNILSATANAGEQQPCLQHAPLVKESQSHVSPGTAYHPLLSLECGSSYSPLLHLQPPCPGHWASQFSPPLPANPNCGICMKQMKQMTRINKERMVMGPCEPITVKTSGWKGNSILPTRSDHMVASVPSPSPVVVSPGLPVDPEVLSLGCRPGHRG